MPIKLDPNSEKPLHIQAEEVLRKLIESEKYKNGKLLPNEVLLSEQLNISRNTLRQAINKLVFEGLLVRKRSWYKSCAQRYHWRSEKLAKFLTRNENAGY